MRFPTIHKFLKWFWPALAGSAIACLGVFAALAQAYPKVNKWGANLFDYWEPIVTVPWFVVLMVILIAGYIWALVYTGGAQKRELGFVLTPDGEPPHSISDKGESTEPYWMPLHKALRYLVYETEWAFNQAKPKTEDEFNDIVSDEFVERLARGEIAARGREYRSAGSQKRASEPISNDYWITGFIQPHGEIALADDKRCAAGNPAQTNSYMQVVVSGQDVERIWPRSFNDGVPQLAQFVEPLRRKIENEKVSVTNPPLPGQTEGVSVTSINQSGGQTAHTIHNREPDPVPARSLNGVQADAIRKVLNSSDIKGEIMEIQFASNEHARFSAQIASLFERCGWERQTMCISHRDKPHTMRVGYKGKKSDAYLLAIEALTAAGFEFKEGEYDGYDADISLDVGILEMTAFQRAADRWPE